MKLTPNIVENGEKILSVINIDENENEEILRYINNRIKFNNEPDKLPNGIEFQNMCKKCNKVIDEEQQICMNETGDFNHDVCPP